MLNEIVYYFENSVLIRIYKKEPIFCLFVHCQRTSDTKFVSKHTMIIRMCAFRIFFFVFFFYFLLPISRESIVFGSNFKNGDFDGFTRYEDSLIQKSHFQHLVWVYVCVCVSVISITQKQITAESSNLVFYICVIAT